jgi:FKBP-type peptidyl-prolyl cis-trans isomerase 2
MVVDGLDKNLEGKEIGKEYEIKLKPKEAFGERRRDLVRIVPATSFTSRNINPRPGMTLALDNSIVRISAVSGGRVTVDFNNPIAGKEVTYKFKILRKVDDEKEKVEALLEVVLRFVPKFEIKDKIVIHGDKMIEVYAKAFSPKFKELLGKELAFQEDPNAPHVHSDGTVHTGSHEH